MWREEKFLRQKMPKANTSLEGEKKEEAEPEEMQNKCHFSWSWVRDCKRWRKWWWQLLRWCENGDINCWKLKWWWWSSISIRQIQRARLINRQTVIKQDRQSEKVIEEQRARNIITNWETDSQAYGQTERRLEDSNKEKVKDRKRKKKKKQWKW